MTDQQSAIDQQSVDRKLRAIFGIAAVFIGVFLVFGVRLAVDQFRDGDATVNEAPSGWLAYDDPTARYSIHYPDDGRVDIVDRVASFTNRDVACPACEPTLLRTFSLTITPDPEALSSSGKSIAVGDEQYPASMTIEGENHLVANVHYQAEGHVWRGTVTFTEPIDNDNPATDQFFEMLASIHHN